MRLAVFKDIPEDPELREQWNALVLGMDQPQVFYTYEWALAVCRAYREALPPHLFVAYSPEDKLCGVAALSVDSAGRHASFLCATTGDYCDFISKAEDRCEFVKSVISELHRLNVTDITLANLPADSPSVEALRLLRKGSRYFQFQRTGYICAQVRLATLERDKRGLLVLPRRKMLRRSLKAMGRENPLEVEHLHSRESLDAVLPSFMRAHVARFLYTGRISNIAHPARRRFLSELAALLSERGWIVLTRMMSADKALAWNYGFRFQHTWFWYQPTFENDLEKYSPGFCLLAQIVEQAVEDTAIQTVDLGLGAEGYKDQFVNHTREILYTTLSTSWTRHLLEVIRYRTTERIFRLPHVEKKLRSFRSLLQRCKNRLEREGIASTLRFVAGRMRDFVWSASEVAFYELPSGGSGHSLQILELRALNWDELAKSAIQYSDDAATLEYLLRSASRLRHSDAFGYVLVDTEGKPLHFAWSTDFDDFFLAELNRRVDGPTPECSMIFDCWTPPALRGHGYYSIAIAAIGQKLQTQGRRPWIFSALANVASVHGVELAGFRKMFTLTRNRLVGLQWTHRSNLIEGPSEAGKVPISPQDSAA